MDSAVFVKRLQERSNGFESATEIYPMRQEMRFRSVYSMHACRDITSDYIQGRACHI